jgi:hypothetical protein
MKLNKQYIIFIIVFILLVTSIVYRVKNPFVQKEVDALTYTGKKKGEINIKQNKRRAGQKQSGDIVSKFLNRPEFSGESIKDLFSLYRDTKDLRGRTEMKGPMGKIIQGKRIMDKDGSDDPIAKIIKDLLSYKFYGTYKCEGSRAIFLVRDKMVLVASTGDCIDGKYLIEEMQDNYIRLKALDLNETIHIDMKEFNNE